MSVIKTTSAEFAARAALVSPMAAPTVAVAKAVESLMPSPSMRAGRPERSMTKATKPQKQGGAPQNPIKS